MANLYKVQAVWSGFIGQVGYTTFYESANPTDLQPYVDFFEDISAGIPDVVSIQLLNEGSVLNDTNGETTAFWSTDPVAAAAGTGTGDYAGGVGILCQWSTAQIVNHRRLRGRNYIVPAVGAVFDSNGTVDESYRTSVTSAMGGLSSALANGLSVWSRPAPGRAGSHATVTGFSVGDKAAILRSRRD